VYLVHHSKNIEKLIQWTIYLISMQKNSMFVGIMI
jgi:hypothetical protein